MKNLSLTELKSINGGSTGSTGIDLEKIIRGGSTGPYDPTPPTQL